MRYAECARCARGIGWIGLVTNAVLMVMKAFVGLVSGSQAMVADAMYSAKDVVTSLVVIVGMTVSEKPLDREHPYGHGKIEFVLSLFISVLFLVVTGYLFVHAIGTLLDTETHRAPHLIALWAALISVAANVGMYFYSRCVAIETNSPMVRTLSKHHHADATASGAVALGIIGSHYLDMPWIDTMVALFETVHLMYLGGDVFKDAYRGLMDRSLDEKLGAKVESAVASTEGVLEVKRIRTRYVGQEIFAEIIIGVDSENAVNEAYRITEQVKENIIKKIPHIGSLQVSSETCTSHASDLNDIRAQWEQSNRIVLAEAED